MHSMWKQWLCGVSSLDKDEGTSCAEPSTPGPAVVTLGDRTDHATFGEPSDVVLLRKLQSWPLGWPSRSEARQQPTRQPRS